MIYSVFLWRKGFRTDDRVTYFLLLVGFALHTAAMIMRATPRRLIPGAMHT